ncbi:ribonuclease H-like domain-containing protein [Tanacetum coccineum]
MWNASNASKNSGILAMIIVNERKEESRALVTVDGECVDWTTHSEDNDNYAFMANNSTGSDTHYKTSELVFEPVVNESHVEVQPKVWSDAPIIEEYESDSDDDDENVYVKIEDLDTPSFATKHVKTPSENVKNSSTHSQKPKVNNKQLEKGIIERAVFVCGIKREYSNARTPQQNGVAERKNRTLIEAARTMLADSFLPNTFWAEATSKGTEKEANEEVDKLLIKESMNKTQRKHVTQAEAAKD